MIPPSRPEAPRRNTPTDCAAPAEPTQAPIRARHFKLDPQALKRSPRAPFSSSASPASPPRLQRSASWQADDAGSDSEDGWPTPRLASPGPAPRSSAKFEAQRLVLATRKDLAAFRTTIAQWLQPWRMQHHLDLDAALTLTQRAALATCLWVESQALCCRALRLPIDQHRVRVLFKATFQGIQQQLETAALDDERLRAPVTRASIEQTLQAWRKQLNSRVVIRHEAFSHLLLCAADSIVLDLAARQRALASAVMLRLCGIDAAKIDLEHQLLMARKVLACR